MLASLHALSPEFDPSWRVVSEDANGKYGWGSVIYVWRVGAQQLGTRIRALLVETRAGKVLVLSDGFRRC